MAEYWTPPSVNFEASFTVRLEVPDPSGFATHCLAVDCILRTQSFVDFDYSVDTPLTFDPNQPLPPTPSITVTPATGLLHNQSVVVEGDGFGENAFVEISECGDSALRYCYDYLASVQADGAGKFSTTVVVTRLASVYGPGGPEAQDCAVVGCSLRAIGYSNGDSLSRRVDAPLSFDASVPPPPLPTVEVTPNTDLPYRAQLAVHGSGFAPNAYVYASFCSLDDGGCNGYADGQADANGDADLVIGVKRRIRAEDGTTILDCADPTTPCAVTVSSNRAYERVVVPVTFDPNAPIPPPPALTVEPHTGLGWKQVVAFAGGGFTPGPQTVTQCGQVEFEPGYSYQYCTGYQQVDVAADGTVSGSFQVQRVMKLGFGPGAPDIDCVTSTTPCVLRVGSGDPDDSASVELGFDPNSQPPPPPVLRVLPPDHLRDGQSAGVWGTGYTPGATIALAPCSADATSIADSCDLGHAFTTQANDQGDFLIPWDVLGVLGTSRGATDCTASAGACILASDNVEDLSEFASTPYGVVPVELELHSTSVVEGTGGVTEGHVMVELSEPIGHPTMVEWRAHPGTATEDDYMSRSGRIMIPAGETEGMIHVRIMGDAINERTERFTVEAIEALGTRITDATATVKIVDDDAEPMVTTKDMTFVEGDHGTKIGVVPVWLSAPSGRDVVVSYRSHHGTARSDTDFVRTRGDVVIKAGDTGAFIFFDIVNDTVREGPESFTMELRDADNAELQDHLSTVTIIDND